MSFFFIALTGAAAAQLSEAETLRNIDNKVHAFSDSTAAGFDDLVKFVKQNFVSDRDRVRAFYTWIAVNISYDKELLDSYKQNSALGLRRLSSLITQNPDTVLKYRKAVCEGYALLMNKCCETCSIVSKMVVGPTKLESGEVVAGIFHAWNAVKTDAAWHLLDVTWANGYVNQMDQYRKKFSDKYFFSPAPEFISDHLPLDPMWQLLEYPLSKRGFYENTPRYSPVPFHFNDSISNYLKLEGDTLEYATFLHYHFFDPDNALYTRECDRIIHDRMVGYMNLAAVYFDDYQRYVARQRGKQISPQLLSTCIRLLRQPEKYLTMALKYSEKKIFFHPEIQRDFEKMTLSARESLKEVEFSIDNYTKLGKAFKTKKK